MGRYINKLSDGTKKVPTYGKAVFLLKSIPGTIKLDTPPTTWQPGLVCVVENGMFDAAAYAYDASEMNYFRNTNGRPATWLIVPGAEDLAK